MWQDALAIAIPTCTPPVVAAWGSRVHALRRVLRKRMLQQLCKEAKNADRRVLHSPLLQSLCATVVAADLAVHDMVQDPALLGVSFLRSVPALPWILTMDSVGRGSAEWSKVSDKRWETHRSRLRMSQRSTRRLCVFIRACL